MTPGPKPIALVLSKTEREVLVGLLRRRSTGQDVAVRARIVLACADPQATNTAIAKRLGVSRQSVVTWRQRFSAHRLDGLGDAPRSGAPRKVTDDAVERLIALTLETQPEGATHWSTRSMAQRTGLSQTMVSRIWRAFGLRPHRHETFKLSSDPAFVDKGPRCHWALSEPACARLGAVCGREAPDPSRRADCARAADAARPG